MGVPGFLPQWRNLLVDRASCSAVVFLLLLPSIVCSHSVNWMSVSSSVMSYRGSCAVLPVGMILALGIRERVVFFLVLFLARLLQEGVQTQLAGWLDRPWASQEPPSSIACQLHLLLRQLVVIVPDVLWYFNLWFSQATRNGAPLWVPLWGGLNGVGSLPAPALGCCVLVQYDVMYGTNLTTNN